MIRISLGVIAGFFAWALAWFACEKGLAAVWPPFAAHQSAFEAALTEGGPFTADSMMLLPHIAFGSVVSALSGFLAAWIAGENKRAPLVLGLLLTAFGLLKAVMSWQYVPLWYHVVFTALLLPLTIIGGKLRTIRQPGERGA